MSALDRIRAFYRATVPEPLRRFVRDRISPPVYSRAFFDELDEMQAASYDVMAESIVEGLRPRSVVDVGCGSGALLAALAKRAVRTTGLEASTAGIRRGRKRGIDVRHTDLSRPFALPPCDVVISLEVAEHLPETSADAFVASLAAAAPRVVFSAATPGQGGTDHVNEQPHAYWVEKFRALGFTLDEATTSEVREEWTRRGVAPWYCNNVHFFTKGATGGEPVAPERTN